MNTIQEIFRINERELASGSTASWHDQYKDSAYIHIGGLPYQLTEGDVITICSQYGEVVDISLPRDPNTQKPRGFAFVMYADQRSTVLAVDNLGGAKVLDRMLKVDHVLNYKQLERDNESGKMKEREEQSLAAHPDKFRAPPQAEGSEAESEDSYGSIDPDDPMAEYLLEQRKASRAAGGGKVKRAGESKEERKKRREEKRAKKAAREAKRLGGSTAPRRIEGGDRERDRREDDRRPRRDEGERKRERSPRRGDDRRDRERDADRYRRDEREPRDSRREEPSRSGAGGARERPRADELWGGDKPDERDRERRERDHRDERDGDRRPRDDRERGGDRRRDEGRGGGGGGAFADLERWAKGR